MDTLPSRLFGAVQLTVRSESRFPARLQAPLQREGEPELGVSLANVSSSGFMVVSPEPLRVGAHVRLVLPIGNPVDAEVIWSLNNQIGCRVEGRFSRRQMAWLVAHSAFRGLPTAAGARAAIVIFLIAFLLFN